MISVDRQSKRLGLETEAALILARAMRNYDVKKLFQSLYVISNNGPDTIGGGPKTDLVNRRAPAAPDFQAQPRNIMPLRDSKTRGGPGNG